MAEKATDKSNGYEQVAEEFVSARDTVTGVAVVREWAKLLPGGASFLDLGCGTGVPISQALVEDGFQVYGVDASKKMIAEFRKRLPAAHAECAAVEESDFFNLTFDAAVAVGLVFLLSRDSQLLLISKVAKVLKPGGNFLFSAPKQVCTWRDIMTGRESISLGSAAYRQILDREGLLVAGERLDECDNCYHFARKV